MLGWLRAGSGGQRPGNRGRGAGQASGRVDLRIVRLREQAAGGQEDDKRFPSRVGKESLENPNVKVQMSNERQMSNDKGC
jgi:hypothetical protein